MKIYMLKEYNTQRIACVSEDIHLIRKTMCDRKFFNPEYNDYPLLSIYENGMEVENVEGGEVLKRIAKEINNLG